MADTRTAAEPGEHDPSARGERAETSARRRSLRRWLRRGAIALGVYVVAVVLGQLAVIAAVLVGRTFGDDPRSDFYGVANFRIVDERVWAGGQPIPQAYAHLYERGVRLVVDLRTGASDDRNEVDLDHLDELGMAYLRLPVPDGNVPSGEQVDRFVDAVERTDGIVLVHCGAGVGRTTSMVSAYLRATGRGPDVLEGLSLGQHTFEQLWFISTGDTNPVVHGLSELLDAPRRAWSRLRAAI